jgi:N-acetylglucosaminyl-diphospho-decaprenol L-rhamnosyltransferase
MTIDIVFVNYHSAGVLRTSIASAMEFAGASARVYIVDNSPDDGGVDLLRSRKSHVEIIQNPENRGFAAAVNQAISAGSGDLVWLVNPDVSEISGARADIETIFTTNRRAGAVAVRLLYPDGSLQHSCRREPRMADFIAANLGLEQRFPRWTFPKRLRMLDWDYANTRVVDAASGGCLFIRRSALEDVGPFDERFFVYGEEIDWLVRAKRRGWQTVFCPRVEAIHILGGSSDIPAEEMSLLLLESNIKYARKHFGRASAAFLRGLLVALDAVRWVRAMYLDSVPPRRRKEFVSRMRVNITGHAAPRAKRAPPRSPGRTA